MLILTMGRKFIAIKKGDQLMDAQTKTGNDGAYRGKTAACFLVGMAPEVLEAEVTKLTDDNPI